MLTVFNNSALGLCALSTTHFCYFGVHHYIYRKLTVYGACWKAAAPILYQIGTWLHQFKCRVTCNTEICVNTLCDVYTETVKGVILRMSSFVNHSWKFLSLNSLISVRTIRGILLHHVLVKISLIQEVQNHVR